MRLRASADRHEIRQQYVPSLWAQLVQKLEVKGKDSVPEVIDLLDSYYLTREDWESIYELGVGPMDQEAHKLDTQTKSTFTRLWVLFLLSTPLLTVTDTTNSSTQCPF
jgi:replication factor C subunit 1